MEWRHLEVCDALEADRTPPPQCWLVQHDPARRPCSGPLERFHFIPRQRVENAMWDMLWEATVDGVSVRKHDVAVDLILLAAWDPRNGGIGCEHHHRRFDKHRTPPLVVPRAELPLHVEEFIADYGFNLAPWLLDRFPGRSGPGGLG